MLQNLSSHQESQTKPIKVFVVDDQRFICQLVKTIIERTCNLDCVGMAHDGESAIALIKAQAYVPDIVVLDLEMPGVPSDWIIQKIVRDFPTIRVLVYSSHIENDYLQLALGAGANGYVIKGNSDSELVDGIVSTHQGHFKFSPDLMENLTTRKTICSYQQRRENSDNTNFFQGIEKREIAERVSLKQETLNSDVETSETSSEKTLEAEVKIEGVEPVNKFKNVVFLSEIIFRSPKSIFVLAIAVLLSLSIFGQEKPGDRSPASERNNSSLSKKSMVWEK